MDLLKRHRQAGMSLIEVLAAVAIVGVVVLAIAGLFTRSVTVNASGMEYILANSLARDRVEQLVALPFNHPDITFGGWVGGMDQVLIRDDSASLPERHRQTFARTVEVREMRLEKLESPGNSFADQLSRAVDPGDGNLKEITVIVEAIQPLQGFRLIGHREIRVAGLKSQGLQ